MSHDREEKSALFDQLATVGKAFASPKRLELINLLSQGERTSTLWRMKPASV